MTDLSKNIEALREKKAVIEMGGGEAAIEKQVAMGKLTARERILALLDKNSFHEYDMFVKHDGRDFGMEKKVLPGDGVVTGTGTIFGAPVCIYAQDFTVAGGSLGLQHARKITKIMDHALKMKCPIIGINDSVNSSTVSLKASEGVWPCSRSVSYCARNIPCTAPINAPRSPVRSL